jgi:hypothetical protein
MIEWRAATALMSGSVTIGAAIGLGCLVSHRLLRYRRTRNEETSPSHLAFLEASLERYRPMVRLLEAEDLRFLASRPGYRPEMGAKMQKSRRRVLRMYLAELSADFQRLHAVARRMAAEAPAQHGDLIPLLVRQQIAFWRLLAGIEVRLALSWTGLGAVDAGGLLKIVEDLEQSVKAELPLPASV